ncbi:MAG TPA: hypothetical protein PKD86_18670 [Gemmatales bacterium]|nr:hypothetical protein [Gemmatales bacterium]HMP61369.1 hypothetical protein [Gemmatales bacterium]
MDFKKLARRLILADGLITDREVEALKTEIYADKLIDAEELEFLIDLRLSARGAVCPAFEQLFFHILKRVILNDGRVSADETTLLRRVLLSDQVVGADERKFLRELMHEAHSVAPEFKVLYDECVGSPEYSRD